MTSARINPFFKSSDHEAHKEPQACGAVAPTGMVIARNFF